VENGGKEEGKTSSQRSKVDATVEKWTQPWNIVNRSRDQDRSIKNEITQGAAKCIE